MLTLVYSGGSMPLTPKAEPTMAQEWALTLKARAVVGDRGVEQGLRRYIGG